MNWFLCTAVGFGAGILAGMGLGGGFILVVYLGLCTAIDQMQAQGINLLFFVPITLSAVSFHIKNRLIDTRVALTCAAFGAIAAVGGFYAANYLGSSALRRLFGWFVVACGIKDLFGASKLDKAEKT